MQNKGKMFVKKSVFHIETEYVIKKKHIGNNKKDLWILKKLNVDFVYLPNDKAIYNLKRKNKMQLKAQKL